MEQPTPTSIIAYMLDHPEFLQQPNNLAVIDAREHISAPKGSLPSPLFVSAILYKGASIDFIRALFTAFDNERLSQETWHSHQGPWIRESPLVTAVRAGRADVIELLLKNFVELLTWMQFLTEDENPEFKLTREEREDRERNKVPATRSPLARHCVTATDCAVQLYGVEKDDEARGKIYHCALTLVTYGTYLSPLTPQPTMALIPNNPPRFVLTTRLITAMNFGMDHYVIAVIRRTLALPRQEPDRQALVSEGLYDILLRAAKSGILPETIRELLDLTYSSDDVLALLPLDMASSPNPIALALTSNSEGGDLDAVNILEMLKYPLMKHAARDHRPWEEYAVWLITDDTVTNEAAKAKHILYFKEHMEYIQKFLLNRVQLSAHLRVQLMKYRTSLVRRTLMNGKSGLANFAHAVESTMAFTNREWMHRAILCGNAGAVELIVSVWGDANLSLETQLPPVDPIMGFPGCERPRSGLNDAVRLRHLQVVIVLLKAGADPNSVEPEEWAALLDELENETMSRFDFIKKYFQYGFFEWGTPIVSQEEMIYNEAIREQVRLITLIARRRSDPEY
ncbi:uncharacterized protein F4812DRAFT_419890 [Daldinia caldariorum]|uniref:uncharacterized protein n=1 Tax=Daldinia caldariorum TaxID=326644 RepID=UPI002008BBB2|nr:uncharacterized protein F4812DRAFT_419890 [Daldinia caldariorum]KAI1469669.1 hypothetical protein F4812DRAFT_419890 [Daldinia caldariorum]